jgi:hypothetical protein
VIWFSREQEDWSWGIFVGRDMTSFIEMFLATEVVFFFAPKSSK